MTELSEEQLNEMGEELLERMGIAVEAAKAETMRLIDGPNNDATVHATAATDLTPEVKSQLSQVGQEEVASAISKGQHDPIVPKQMTRQVWKQMMRIHFTIRRGKAQPCEHKLSSINVPNEKGETTVFITSDPRKNCDSCWFTYFNTNGQMTQIADECFREAGRDVLERSRGKRFVKYFLRFMSTIARFQREAAEREAANGVKVEGTTDDSTTGGGSPSTDSGISGLVGEAQSIGGINEGSDPSIGSENPVDGSPVEGLGTGLSGL